jgi:hypothetical protein
VPLEITKLLVPNGHVFLNASPAALVRLINQGHEAGALPTIMHDEIDNVFKLGNADPTNATLLSVFNQGYTPSVTVPRCVGQGTTFEVKQMPCYAAIAFAGLRGLPDTLESRAIKIRMKRRANDEEKESFRRRPHVQEADPIADTLSGWCAMYKEDFSKAVDGDGPDMPEGIEDRTADCWEPLLAIADVAASWDCGAHWPERARAAAVYLTGAARDDLVTTGVELLAHIKEAFLDATKIHTSTLRDRLQNRDESPWRHMGRHQPQGVPARRLRGRLQAIPRCSPLLSRKGYQRYQRYRFE